MIGIGQNLMEPRLTQNQCLNAETLHRLFGSKIVWLSPHKNLLYVSSFLKTFLW